MKIYIGDSVYADVDEFGTVTLTTENGYPDDPRNRIVLEPQVWLDLVIYVTAKADKRRENYADTI